MDEGHEPDVLVDLTYAHLLARKDLAQIHLPALEADATAPCVTVTAQSCRG